MWLIHHGQADDFELTREQEGHADEFAVIELVDKISDVRKAVTG